MQMKKYLMLAFALSLCLHLGAEGVFCLNASKEETVTGDGSCDHFSSE